MDPSKCPTDLSSSQTDRLRCQTGPSLCQKSTSKPKERLRDSASASTRRVMLKSRRAKMKKKRKDFLLA